jgi:DNA polymerase-1
MNITVSDAEISFCVSEETAHSAIDRMIADAPNGMVAIDLETAPNQSEIDRLTKLRLQLAETKGRLKAAVKLKQPLDVLQAEIKRLNAAIDYTEGAGLDPHRARIRLLQLYGGGTHAAVIDIDRTGPGVLRRLEDMRVVAHNAVFELSFLEKVGVTPREMHCTAQTTRLLTGRNKPSLEYAAQEFLGIKVAKTLQTSDWNAPHLSMEQLRYAATDAVIGRRLARHTLLTLNQQASAYTIQMTVMPAVVRMQLRGFLLDRVAHAALIVDLGRRRIETIDAYVKACREQGIDATVPETPRHKQALLMAQLTSPELAVWARTPRSQELSTKRVELKKARHYPPIAALLDLSKIDKAIASFGENLAEHINPITGRIHSSYGIAATASGRASCSKPNLQQIPKDVEFRNLFGARHGYVLVVGDYDLMEMRASAHTSGDQAMTKALAEERDLHRLTASSMTGKRPEDVTNDERQAAKTLNFGAVYGQGAKGLVAAAWNKLDIVLSLEEAERWGRALKETYSQLSAWKDEHAKRCEAAGRIIIGRDAARGIGRMYLQSWVPEGEYFYTKCCNLPIQGACADASMLALAYVDQRLFDADIDGGPVGWVHDEIVLEVREDQAERASEILKQSMVDAFLEIFPGAPTAGLIKPKICANWGEGKAGAPKPGKSQAAA